MSNGGSARRGSDQRKRAEKSLPAEDASQIRDKILAGAEEVFARYGLHGATTAMIASAAGISKPHIYYYFSSKETLYNAVLERTLTLWNSAIPTSTSGLEPQAFLREYIRAKLEFSRSSPKLSRIFANEILNGAPILRGRIKTDAAAALGRLVKLFDGWQAARKIKPIDSAHLVFMIWGMTQYYANSASELEILLGKRQLDDDDFQAAQETITRLVFAALGLKA
ncbi:MAG: TetR family transcriptional regulator C-terminal domain-containing protein [Hyphomicrobiaceae bacterium]|nr:TetR family transcriptional regulator C-terminal domain-containing protein [Hyphomicrobiaceae bacterium]